MQNVSTSRLMARGILAFGILSFAFAFSSEHASASMGSAAQTPMRYGGAAPGAKQMSSLNVRRNVGVRYAFHAAKNTPLNRPLMNAIKANDERFNACYAQSIDSYSPRTITTLSFRLGVDAPTARVVRLTRVPGSQGDKALAHCVGTLLRRLVLVTPRNVDAVFKVQFAHAYERVARSN